jgi:hypothetical protein
MTYEEKLSYVKHKMLQGGWNYLASEMVFVKILKLKMHEKDTFPLCKGL